MTDHHANTAPLLQRPPLTRFGTKCAPCLLVDSPEPDAEEWAIHDYEGFEGASLSEYASFETVCELADFIEANYPGSDNAHLTEVAQELLPEALDAGRAAARRLCAALETSGASA